MAKQTVNVTIEVHVCPWCGSMFPSEITLHMSCGDQQVPEIPFKLGDIVRLDTDNFKVWEGRHKPANLDQVRLRVTKIFKPDAGPVKVAGPDYYQAIIKLPNVEHEWMVEAEVLPGYQQLEAEYKFSLHSSRFILAN